MNVERLTHLLEIMEGVRDRQLSFNIGAWLTHPPASQSPKEPKDQWCGTTACALGYAALDPIFSEAGLKIKFDGRIIDTLEEFNTIVHDGTKNRRGIGVWDVSISYNGEIAYEAGAAFFGISDQASEWLFDNMNYDRSEYNNPSAVIARIKKVIERGNKLRLPSHV
jgi:hypothetical protein